MQKSAPQPATRSTPSGGRKRVMIMRKTAPIIVWCFFLYSELMSEGEAGMQEQLLCIGIARGLLSATRLPRFEKRSNVISGCASDKASALLCDEVFSDNYEAVTKCVATGHFDYIVWRYPGISKQSQRVPLFI
jgi:hypothetical protein